MSVESAKKKTEVYDGIEYHVYEINAELVSWVQTSQYATYFFPINDAYKQIFKALGEPDAGQSIKNSMAVIKELWKYYDIIPPYPFLDKLSEFQFDRYLYPGYRDHVAHQLKVYLLGLYLFEKVPTLHAYLIKSLQKYKEPIKEFAVRWLVASVFHDVGYVLDNEKVKQDENELESLLSEFTDALYCPISSKIDRFPKFTKAIEEKIVRASPGKIVDYSRSVYISDHRIEDLGIFDEEDLLAKLDPEAEVSGLGDNNSVPILRRYYRMADKYPVISNDRQPFLDHGISSALFLMHLWQVYKNRIDDFAANASKLKSIKEMRNFFAKLKEDTDLSSETIRSASAAIALHNLDPRLWLPRVLLTNHLYDKAFELSVEKPELSLAYLLKLTDTLQDWGRCRFRMPRQNDKRELTDQDMRLEINDSGQIVLSFLEDRQKRKNWIGNEESQYYRTIKEVSLYCKDAKILFVPGEDDGVHSLQSPQIPEHFTKADYLKDLLETAYKVETTINDLSNTIIECALPDKFLFPSNASDRTISATVSSIILVALHKTNSKYAQSVCDDLLKCRRRIGFTKHLWKDEKGAFPHCMCNAWGIFSVLKARPTSCASIKSATKWLISIQNPDGGWGFIKNKPSRVIYSAFALNAFIEYLRAAKLTKANTQSHLYASVFDCVRRGIDFISSSSSKTKLGYLYWGNQAGSPDICLASTSMALHVLSKWSTLSSYNQENIGKTALLLFDILKEGPLQADSKYDDLNVISWPEFTENGPNYWYKYFTPVITITLFKTAKYLGIPNTAVHLESITNSVKWILDHKVRIGDKYFISYDTKINGNALWVNAQAIIALKDWKDSFDRVVYSNPSLDILKA